jgi:hypothetical protein
MQLQTSYKLTIESTLYSFEDECIFSCHLFSTNMNSKTWKVYYVIN